MSDDGFAQNAIATRNNRVILLRAIIHKKIFFYTIFQHQKSVLINYRKKNAFGFLIKLLPREWGTCAMFILIGSERTKAVRPHTHINQSVGADKTIERK